MSNVALRRRQGTTTDISAHTHPAGTVEIDVSKPTLVVHNGTDAGGVPLAKEIHTHVNATGGSAGFMSAADKTKLDLLSAEGGYSTIQNLGVSVAQESTLNFDGNFVVADNPGTNATDVSISQAFRDSQNAMTVALILALT